MAMKKTQGERTIIKPRGGRLRPTGKIRQTDGTIRTIPEIGIKNIKGVRIQNGKYSTFE
mgnify:FL=1|tara:strand:- start:2257 stop:2433 length:177 start_codon:yes stop_codon:yes gene_type:complete